MASFKYKGYTLTQCEEGEHHYMICDGESGKPVMHVAYTGGLFTQAEAEHQIDNYLMLRDRLPNILEGEGLDGKSKKL